MHLILLDTYTMYQYNWDLKGNVNFRALQV